MPGRVKIIYWQDGEFWLGYTEEYPDYMTQGMTLDELKNNLRDIYMDLSSGLIPCARKEDELILA
ncbi:MAG: type II toxin-antitoxin system HicB family antitoxin [Thermodesulfobacteriota bacterium]